MHGVKLDSNYHHDVHDCLQNQHDVSRSRSFELEFYVGVLQVAGLSRQFSSCRTLYMLADGINYSGVRRGWWKLLKQKNLTLISPRDVRVLRHHAPAASHGSDPIGQELPGRRLFLGAGLGSLPFGDEWFRLQGLGLKAFGP